MKKLFLFLALIVTLTGCSKADEEKKTLEMEKNKIKILMVAKTSDFDDYLGSFEAIYSNHILNSVVKYKKNKDVEIEVERLKSSNINDLKNKLATKLYGKNDYDIVMFDNNEVRVNVEKEEVMEDITSIEVYDDIFNSIKNKYFVPLAYVQDNAYYPVEDLNELGLTEEYRQKYGPDEIFRRIARREKVRPGQLEMEREAREIELKYEMNDELKIDMESVRKFRDEFREILLTYYKLDSENNEDYVKEKFRDKTNDWRGLFSGYAGDYSGGYISTNMFDLRCVKRISTNGDDRGKPYEYGKKCDMYYLNPKESKYRVVYTAGVLKKSKNKELAFDFINYHILNEEERIKVKDYGDFRYQTISLRSSIEKLSKEQEKYYDRELIDSRNKGLEFLDKELGELLEYNIATDKYIKNHVMYAIRPYILDDYNEEEVKRRVKDFEKQVNLILAEKE